MKRDPGVLLLHGFTSSLDTVNGLVPHLEAEGLPYRMPILRGHCTQPEDLMGVEWRDWVDDAAAALAELRQETDQVIVVGLSMGGLVALTLAMEQELAGVVTVAAALRLRDLRAPLSPLLAPFMGMVDAPRPELRYECTNYTCYPARAGAELYKFGRWVETRLPQVKAPLCVIAARLDRVVAPSGSAAIYTRVSSSVRQIHWFDESGHEMMQDIEKEGVFETIMRFIRARRAELMQAV